MGTFSITWNRFTVHKKHDIDRDRPYLWVFGIVIDADTVVSRRFVTRRRSDSQNLVTSSISKYGKGDSSDVPSALDLHMDVTPLVGLLTAGVVVVAWENATTKDSVIEDAYDAAADAIDSFVSDLVDDRLADLLDQLAAGEDPHLDPPSDAEIAQLTAAVEDEVRSTIKSGWTIFQLVPDHDIGTAYEVVSLDGDHDEDLDFRFVKGSTDYELKGRLSYSAAAPTSSKPPSNPPPPPPGKVLQSPKPQSTVRG